MSFNIVRLTIFILALFSLKMPLAVAQGSGSSFGPEYSGHIGTLLPNQIDGVTEILPAWGLRYSRPFSFAVVEAGYRNSHAKGVDFAVYSLDLRFDIDDVQDFTKMFYIGYDMNAYRPTFREDKIWTGGAHLGAGLMMRVSSQFWLRGDLSFAVSPGTSLYLGFGFAIRSPAGGG